jgi:hypothetical protein
MNRLTMPLIAALAAASLSLTSATFVAAAPTDECPLKDFCVSDEIETPGEPATPASQGGDEEHAGGHRATGPVCTWEESGVAGPAGGVDGGPFLEVVGTKSPGAALQAEVCDGVYTGRVRWVAAGTPAPTPAPPAPELLASIVRVPEPTVASTPAPGVAALVGYPSFVSVTNWTRSGRAGDRVTPSLIRTDSR